jgi:hypothetical protein
LNFIFPRRKFYASRDEDNRGNRDQVKSIERGNPQSHSEGFLEKKLRELRSEIYQIHTKYKIKSVEELEEKYKKGKMIYSSSIIWSLSERKLRKP